MNDSQVTSRRSPALVCVAPGEAQRPNQRRAAWSAALPFAVIVPLVASFTASAAAQTAVTPAVTATAAATVPAPVTPAATVEVAPVVTTPPVVEVAPPAPEPVPEVAVAPVPEPAPAPEPPPAADVLPSVDVGVWMRVGVTLQDPTKPKRLDDIGLSSYGELHLSGKVHKMVSYTLNMNASGLVGGATPVAGHFGIMDAIVGLDFDDLFHIWSGQLLVASDRSNFSGPFFMIPWNYPGLAGGAAGPKEGPYGRNTGSVIWGDAGKGKFKYYFGAYGLDDARARPFYSGRLNLAIIGAEPGFYHNSTYYGSQNILAVGVGGQYQNDGITNGRDYGLINGDVLAEFKAGESVVTAEGAVYGFPTKDAPYKSSFMLLGAFLTPDTPLGKLHPMIRYQHASAAASQKDYIVDASVGAVIKGFNLRGVLGFQHADLGNAVANQLHLGIQTIEF